MSAKHTATSTNSGSRYSKNTAQSKQERITNLLSGANNNLVTSADEIFTTQNVPNINKEMSDTKKIENID